MVRPWRVVFACLVALAIIGGAAVAGSVLHHRGPRYPSHWDPKVADIVRVVERERGLRFDHPVPIYFLSSTQYRHLSAGDDVARPSKSDRASAKRDAGQLRAFGLVQGEVDLIGSSKDLSDSGTLAFYDQTDKVVNVRGSEMTPALRVTLAHELTHALQDQNFDLEKLLDTNDSDEATAIRAVIEGDAIATEDAYVGQLSDDERASYEAESSSTSDDAQSKLDGADVPDVLTTLFGLPYALGSSFVSLVDAKAGSDDPDLSRANDVFRRPPRSTAELFTPQDYLDRPKAVSVKAPATKGEEFDAGTLGAGYLFVLLAERIDPAKAMVAIDGWRGDAYRAVEVGSGKSRRVCVSVKVATKSDGDGRELRDALDAWAEAMPSEASSRVGGSGRDATLRTCDAGTKVDMGLTNTSYDALAYPVVRAELAAGQVTGGVGRVKSLCIASKVVASLSLDELQADELSDELQKRLERLILDAAGSCR